MTKYQDSFNPVTKDELNTRYTYVIGLHAFNSLDFLTTASINRRISKRTL